MTLLSLYSLLQEGYGLIIFAHPGLVRPTLGSSPQDRDQIQGLEDSEGDSEGSPGRPALWPAAMSGVHNPASSLCWRLLF